MSRQSILTKYIPASNSRGSRIKAVQSGWSEKSECVKVIIDYPLDVSSEQAHAMVARKLAEKLGWKGKFIPASLGAWSEYAFVWVLDDGDGFSI